MCINTNYNKIDDYHGSNSNFDDNDNIMLIMVSVLFKIEKDSSIFILPLWRFF